MVFASPHAPTSGKLQLVFDHLAHMLAKVKLVLEHPPALPALVHVITISVLLFRLFLRGDYGCVGIENSITGLKGSSCSVASAR